MTQKTKIAVIGTGWWATQAHIPALLQNPQSELVIIDQNPEKLKRTAEVYGLQNAYTSLTDALSEHKDIQGAIVAVSHRAHYPVAREVLENGLHLLLEKPMTLFAADAKSLVELAQQKQVEILMGYVYPYLEPVRTAKAFLEANEIGDIEYVTCCMSSMTIEFLRGRPQEYGALFDYPVTGPTEQTYSSPEIAGGGQGHLQATHVVSLMFHLAEGLRAKTVSAFTSNLDCAVDVVDAFSVKMENGALVTVGSTGNLGKGDGGIVEVHLHGSKGRLRVDAISGRVEIRMHDGTEKRIEASYPTYMAAEPSRQFVDIIRNGAKNYLPANPIGWYTVELLDAAYRSAQQDGQPVQVKSLYE